MKTRLIQVKSVWTGKVTLVRRIPQTERINGNCKDFIVTTDRLFSQVDTSILRKPTYEALIDLQDNFRMETGVAETETTKVSKFTVKGYCYRGYCKSYLKGKGSYSRRFLQLRLLKTHTLVRKVTVGSYYNKIIFTIVFFYFLD